MTGQMSIYDWLNLNQPETCEIKKSHFSDWQTVSLADALAFAHEKWNRLQGVRESIRAEYINTEMIKGYRFTEKEIIEGVME